MVKLKIYFCSMAEGYRISRLSDDDMKVLTVAKDQKKAGQRKQISLKDL